MIAFHLDVAGVGIATVISQCISCILVLRCLYPVSYTHLRKLALEVGATRVVNPEEEDLVAIVKEETDGLGACLLYTSL